MISTNTSTLLFSISALLFTLPLSKFLSLPCCHYYCYRLALSRGWVITRSQKEASDSRDCYYYWSQWVIDQKCQSSACYHCSFMYKSMEKCNFLSCLLAFQLFWTEMTVISDYAFTSVGNVRSRPMFVAEYIPHSGQLEVTFPVKCKDPLVWLVTV